MAVYALLARPNINLLVWLDTESRMLSIPTAATDPFRVGPGGTTRDN